MSNELDQIFVSEDKKTEPSKETVHKLPELPGIKVLRVIAWIVLILGIIGSIVIWATLSTTEVTEMSSFGTHFNTAVVDRSGIITGFVVLFSSTLFWAISIVICTMADYLISINHKLGKILPKDN